MSAGVAVADGPLTCDALVSAAKPLEVVPSDNDDPIGSPGDLAAFGVED